MNKMLSAIALSAFMATAAQAEQPQANAAPQSTAADQCIANVMNTITKDVSEALNDLQDIVKNGSDIAAPKVHATYSKEFMRGVASACEASTQTKASPSYTKFTVTVGDNSVTFER